MHAACRTWIEINGERTSSCATRTQGRRPRKPARGGPDSARPSSTRAPPWLPRSSRDPRRGLAPARDPPSSPRPSPGPAPLTPLRAPAASPCRPREHALSLPGVVGYVPDEQRRVGGTQVAGHDGTVSFGQGH